VDKERKRISLSMKAKVRNEAKREKSRDREH
jgi:ribosomal protein S1